jgi:hypothetical protein
MNNGRRQWVPRTRLQVPEQGTDSMAQPKPFGGTGTAASAATEVI